MIRNFLDAGFVTAKNRQQQQVHHFCWQSLQFMFNSSVEILCNSWISAAKCLSSAES